MADQEHIELLQRIVLKDRAAFARFYQLTSGRVYAVATQMLGNRSAAQDLLQDVYLKVWYSADRFDSLRGDPLAWLVAMTRNRAIDTLRRPDANAAPAADAQDPAPEMGPDPADPRLGHCVQQLEDQQRQSIFAAFYQGLTHSEIASRFAEPIGTIKSRVRRGLAALRECLET